MHHGRRLPDDALHDQPMQMLDSLDEIPLKGFPEMEETPTSATMSLPTPDCDHLPLPRDGPMEVPPDMPVSLLFPSDDAGIVVPGAPRMKDYDSFTEGSKEGSFASLPAADTNEFGEPIYPVSALALEALPMDDSHLSIEQWRQDVDEHLVPQEPVEPAPAPAQAHPSFIPIPILRSRSPADALPTIMGLSDSEAGTTPTNTKRPRPRSNASEDSDGARRNRRPRAGTPPSASPRARAQSFSTSASSGVQNHFLWVDHGPPPNAYACLRPRPPSRANSAPD